MIKNRLIRNIYLFLMKNVVSLMIDSVTFL